MSTSDLLMGQGLLSRRALTRTIMGGSAAGLLAIAAGPAAQSANGSPTSRETVEDHIAIEQLIYRFAMALDNRDPVALAGCFAAGALPAGQVDKMLEFHRQFEYTMHNVLNHVFEVQDGTATGVVYCIVSYVKKTADKLTKFDVYSEYPDDKLVKQGKHWLFVDRAWKPIFSTAEVPVQEDVPPGFWDRAK